MKLKETMAIEKALMIMTEQNRTFGCPEVTIGWYGNKRVDFMETNTRGLIKCYEIKVTKSDFRSKHGHNFVGNYNYYAMTKDLYDKVKEDIPKGIGVLVLSGKFLIVAKKATYQKINNSQSLLLNLIRSMSREVKKSFDSKDLSTLSYLKREISKLKKSLSSAEKEVRDLRRESTKLHRKK